jgi:predicted pyridoxine 5'-phosphate oxidase superfamily flavin-nucleotide-binding protein
MYELSSSEAHYGFGGGSGEIGVTNLSGCLLDPMIGNNWLKITAVPGGTNSGTVRYTVASNATVLARSAVIVIGNQRFLVSQDGLRDVARPVVRITSPAPNARTTNWIVTGTAIDNGSVAAVKVRVGDGEPLIATGTNAWSIDLAGVLVPGTNVLRVQSVDLATNESAVVTQRFVFIATSVLTVRTNGSGAVSPSLNGRRLEVGRAYALTATPGAGYVFSNWTGGLTAGNSSLSFIMRSNLVLNANFVPNPFLRIKGAYNGLFTTSALDHQHSGSINLALTERGTFTASLQTGGRRLAFTGAFDLRGLAIVTVPRPGTNALTVELAADLSPGGTSITGRVRDELLEAPLFADRAVFNPVTNPATNFAGRYTVILPGDTNSAASPAGDGFGVLTVDRGGMGSFVGTLADGSPMMVKMPLSKEGGWPLYVALYGGKGSLLSAVTLTNLPTEDMEGEFRWIKPALAATRFYSNGFARSAT